MEGKRIRDTDGCTEIESGQMVGVPVVRPGCAVSRLPPCLGRAAIVGVPVVTYIYYLHLLLLMQVNSNQCRRRFNWVSTLRRGASHVR